MTQSPKGVFLSYASEDSGVAQRICASLQAAGIEVWFDQSELRGGDAWDHKIRQQIRDCALFVPIISAHTQARPEGYFRLEWKLAVDRSHLMAAEKAFLVPVVVDATTESEALVPAHFREVQWTRLPASDVSTAFTSRIAALLDQPVAHHGAGAERVVDRVRAGRSPALLIAVAVAVLVAIAAATALRGGGSWHRTLPTVDATTSAEHLPASAPMTPETSVAVLPFVDMSEKKDQEYLSDGLSEELIDMLTKVPNLRVPARTSSFYFKGKQTTIADIAKALHVAYVLEGSLRKAGKHVRITTQLVRADNGYHLWSETFDRQLDDIFKIQDEIAGDVVKALKISLIEGRPLGTRTTENVNAYALYLQGRFVGDRAVWDVDTDRAISYTHQALREDPKFALAWAWLSRLYADKRGSEAESLKLRDAALAAARKSLDLDSTLAEGRIAMAKISLNFDSDLENFDRQIALAYKLEPANSDVLAWMGTASANRGRWDEAVRFVDRAIASDPLNPNRYMVRGNYYLRLGRYEDAEASFRKTLELNPQNLILHWYIAETLFLRKRYAEAREELMQEQEEGRDLGFVFLDYAMGRVAESDAGMLAVERRYGSTTRWVAAYYLACARAFRGEKDKAFEWLDLAYRRRETFGMQGDPLLKNLETDPRYQNLIRKMQMPESRRDR